MKTIQISKLKVFVFILSLILTTSSCRLEEPYPLNGSRNIVEEKIPLNNFNRMETEDSFNIYVKRGPSFSIIAKGDNADINDLEAKVNNGKLKIKYKNYSKHRFEMMIYITMPNLVEANFSGLVLAEINNFNENKICINASGASDIFIDSDAKKWEINLSGSTFLELQGSGNFMILDASGGSDLKAPNLILNEIDLNVSGSSSARVFAYDEIVGKASGSSEVRYRGNPYVNIALKGSSWVSRD